MISVVMPLKMILDALMEERSVKMHLKIMMARRCHLYGNMVTAIQRTSSGMLF